MADDVVHSFDLNHLISPTSKKSGGKSAFQVQPPSGDIPKAVQSAAEREASLRRTGAKKESTMRKVKVKHNSLRNRALSVDGVVFHFDESGICQVPEALMDTLRVYMHRSPGRIVVVAEAVVTPSLDELKRRADAALTAHQAKLEEEVSALLEVVDKSITEPEPEPVKVAPPTKAAAPVQTAVEKKPAPKKKEK